MILRPILAATIDPLNDPEVFKKLKFPYLASPKLDGIRAVAGGKDFGLYSRKAIQLPSNQAQRLYGHLLGLDGELIVGLPTDMNVYNTTQSHVMSQNKNAIVNGLPNLYYYLFDRWFYDGKLVTHLPFYRRLELLPSDNYLRPVPHIMIYDLEDLLKFETKCLEEGYEGIMLRDPNGLYKEGRSTFNQNYLFKLKRFVEFEALVVGFEEQQTNTNEKVKDALGLSKRSTAQANMIPANTLGKLLVEYQGDVIEVGCGCMTAVERKTYWNNPDLILRKEIVVRHFQVGLDGYKPRFPRFVGFRKDGR